MKAAIIAIGDELLIGNTVDTNSAWIAKKLNPIGVRITRRFTVGDVEGEILYALEEALKVSDLVLITGGLGPTSDDITKDILNAYFGGKLVLNTRVLQEITAFFNARGLAMTKRNESQAMLPDVCTPLYNAFGTAAGMMFEKDNRIVVSMPGVPYEMEAMINNDIVPLINERFSMPPYVHKHVNTFGIGESFLADRLVDFEKNLPSSIRLAYLPNRFMVRLRLTAEVTKEGGEGALLDDQIEQLMQLTKDVVFSSDDVSLEEAVGKLLLERNKTMATAESCTGGYIAHRVTSIPGSSAYYKGSVVSYANDVKSSLLGVRKRSLEQEGAVSEAVVLDMIDGILKQTAADYAIAVSGVAGPAGGTREKPVGTVWIAVGSDNQKIAQMYTFKGDRWKNIESTSLMALNMLRKFIVGDQH